MVVRHRAVVVVIVALIAVVVLATVAPAATYRVRGRFTDVGFRWRPKTLEVPTGSKVVWKMIDGTHNVRSIGSNWSKTSGNIGEGGRTSHTFPSAGTYRYRCTLHSTVSDGRCSGMCGKVVVG